MIRPPPRSPLFPYPPLSRSRNRQIRRGLADELLRRAFSPERARRDAPRAATLLRAHLRPLVPAVARAQRIERYSVRSEEHTSELQSQSNLVCRLLLEKKKTQ